MWGRAFETKKNSAVGFNAGWLAEAGYTCRHTAGYILSFTKTQAENCFRRLIRRLHKSSNDGDDDIEADSNN